MLAGPRVIEAMVETYRRARAETRELSERLLLALEAGQAEGGTSAGSSRRRYSSPGASHAVTTTFGWTITRIRWPSFDASMTWSFSTP